MIPAPLSRMLRQCYWKEVRIPNSGLASLRASAPILRVVSAACDCARWPSASDRWSRTKLSNAVTKRSTFAYVSQASECKPESRQHRLLAEIVTLRLQKLNILNIFKHQRPAPPFSGTWQRSSAQSGPRGFFGRAQDCRERRTSRMQRCKHERVPQRKAP